MKSTIESAVSALKKECGKFAAKDPSVRFHNDKIEEFHNSFSKYYDDIMERFMKETEALDSHKQAAIIVVSCLESGIITAECTEKGKITIATQLIAVTVALSYMNDMLNKKIGAADINIYIDKYIFPEALSCDTPYLEIICRLLYYEQHEPDMNFNILEIADRFFLLEYLNLLQHEIDPLKLREHA